MNKLKYFFILFLFPLLAQAQEELTMTLEDCIELASKQSLDAFLAKNMYLASYWDYRSYKASRLPSLNLESTPISLKKDISQEWNNDNNNYDYYQINKISSNAALNITQQVALTGGTLELVTENSYYKKISSPAIYTSSPIYISYKQNLNGYNSLKWRAKIDPESYKAAKQNYLETREEIAMSAISYFFNLINAQIDLDISTRNLSSSEELFRIGKGRFEVGTIKQDELLNLELNYYNAQLDKTKAEQSLLKARVKLNIFLNIDKSTTINCIIPEEVPNVTINLDDALTMAKQNNSAIIDLHINELKYEQNLAKTKADNRFSSTLSMSYGLSSNVNYNDNFINSYKDPQDKQNLSLTFSIPIIDWGEGKGAVAVAKSNLEAQRIKNTQAINEFEQNVNENVLEFNIQKLQVNNSAKADTIAQKAYDISYEIFKLGKLDVINLNQARNDQESARKAYISSLKSYWTYWYKIRQLTLFDFNKNITLSEDFERLINE